MANDFSPSVEKIVSDYLRRLRSHLKGLPSKDQDELVREIYSHIFESFTHHEAADEIDRILAVLGRLGEPEDVVADRVAASMLGMGRKRKWPLYIVGGLLMGMIGLPLAGTGVVVLLSLVLFVLTLVAMYYLTAASLVALGSLGFFVTIAKWISPEFVSRLGEEIGRLPEFDFLPVRLLLCFLLSGTGLLMFWGGRYLMRGLKFVIALVPKGIHNYKDRRRRARLGLQS